MESRGSGSDDRSTSTDAAVASDGPPSRHPVADNDKRMSTDESFEQSWGPAFSYKALLSTDVPDEGWLMIRFLTWRDTPSYCFSQDNVEAGEYLEEGIADIDSHGRMYAVEFGASALGCTAEQLSLYATYDATRDRIDVFFTAGRKQDVDATESSKSLSYFQYFYHSSSSPHRRIVGFGINAASQNLTRSERDHRPASRRSGHE